MPDDLISKFFSGDLTETEEKALSEKLLHSTDDALKFGEKAQKLYQGYGLPDPKWQGGHGPTHHGGPGHGAGPSAGHSAWPHPIQQIVHLSVKHWVISSAIATTITAGVMIVHQATQKTVPQPVPTVVPTIVPVLPTPTVPSVLRATAKPMPVPAQPSPMMTPLDVSADPQKILSSLSVVIHRSSPGQVTVRVLDAQGQLVVLLFEGTLNNGNWAFDWNGKYSDGRAAAPGPYQIEMQTGDVIKRKSVVIH